MGFPATRMRRLRRTAALRGMVRETRLAAEQLVLPLFACPGEGVARAIGSMPGVYQHSVDRLVEAAAAAWAVGVRGVMLFGLPEHKDAVGSAAWDDDGIVQQALRALGREVPGLVRIVDLCFCEYTDHGHCGVLTRPIAPGAPIAPEVPIGPGVPIGDVEVDNDATLANLARQAVSLAKAGADVIAPSDMMDGRIGAVRAALDA
ncbi:MAG TPA: porphobilinogen synthase, partial [Thermoanaerobaculia bacterium]|nr:porphobilinogen synthase [Thermoanaerobaculia bacterium]